MQNQAWLKYQLASVRTKYELSSRLGHSIHRQAQDPGLGTGLAGELWALTPMLGCTYADGQKNQGWGHAMLDKATTPVSIYAGQFWVHVGLS